MLNNLSGIAGVQQSLERTNELLAQVLEALRETNEVRLEAIAEELRRQGE